MIKYIYFKSEETVEMQSITRFLQRRAVRGIWHSFQTSENKAQNKFNKSNSKTITKSIRNKFIIQFIIVSTIFQITQNI